MPLLLPMFAFVPCAQGCGRQRWAMRAGMPAHSTVLFRGMELHAASRLALARLRQIAVADDLAERSRQRPVLAAPLSSRQEREHELGEAIRLFEMRIAGEDERLDPEVRVLAHA